MFKDKIVWLFKQAKAADIIMIVVGISTLVYLAIISPGIEGQYDLMMYHAYNGWAGVNGIAPITEQFFHPAYTHTYFSNYIDIFQWLLLDNFNAVIASGILALVQLLTIIPLYLINTQLFKTYSKVRNFSIALLSLSSANFFIQLGGYSGDIISSIPVLFAFYWALKYVDSLSTKNIMLTGLALGLSLALKLTNVGYILFFVALALYVAYKKQWLHVLWFGLVSVGTFIVTMIPYLMKTLEASGGKNPFFPNYNNIFKAETFPEISFTFDVLKVAPNKIGEWLYNNLVSNLSHDFRVTAFIVMVAAAAFLYIFKSVKKTEIENKRFILVGLFFATYVFYALFFGIDRYYMSLTVLFMPVIFLVYEIISDSFLEIDFREKIFTYVSASLAAIILLTTNPVVYMPYQLNDSKEMFDSVNIKELNKYDAVIVTGPMHMSWLAVVNRDYIIESNQAWLSSAFNRIDALAADGILKDKNSIGYVVQSGKQKYAKQNLETLGYTTSDNCLPIKFDRYYGNIYDTFLACDAVYTGKYYYKLVPADKILLGKDANPITEENKSWFGFVNYK